MTPEEEQVLATALRYIELANSLGPTYPDEICAPDVRTRLHPRGTEIVGIEATREVVARIRRATPNRHFDVRWSAVSGTKAVLQGTYTFTVEAEEPGMPPVGTEGPTELCIVVEVREGRIWRDDTYGT